MLSPCSPRVKLDDGKVRMITPPWSGNINGFTLLFEAFLIQSCQSMPVHNVSKLTNVSDFKLWKLLELYIDSDRNTQDFSNVQSIGIDETSVSKGHDYLYL